MKTFYSLFVCMKFFVPLENSLSCSIYYVTDRTLYWSSRRAPALTHNSKNLEWNCHNCSNDLGLSPNLPHERRMLCHYTTAAVFKFCKKLRFTRLMYYYTNYMYISIDNHNSVIRHSSE